MSQAGGAGGHNPPPNPGPYPARKVKLKKGDTKKGPTPAANVESMCYQTEVGLEHFVSRFISRKKPNDEAPGNSGSMQWLLAKPAIDVPYNYYDRDGDRAKTAPPVTTPEHEASLSQKAAVMGVEGNKIFQSFGKDVTAHSVSTPRFFSTIYKLSDTVAQAERLDGFWQGAV